MGSQVITYTTTVLPGLFGASPDLNHESVDGHWVGDVANAAWKDIELPEEDSAWKEAVQGKPFDLSVLWEVLEKHKEQMEEKEESGKHINTTWELVVVQGVLLTLLVMISVSWAFCCKRRCFKQQPTNPSVAEALRKLSIGKDLPPSYSTRDLHTLGISVNDYLNPPPEYLELFTDNLQYLDLEQGHNRLAKLSFCSEDGSVPRGARLSVASCENCSSESPVVVPVRSDRSSVSSSSSSSSSNSSRRQSRNSRVSFSEDVECSNGSVRRLSSNSLIGLGANPSSRKSSSSSEGSRRSSLISKVQRKMGSNNQETFAGSLDQELQLKLASIGDDDSSKEQHQTNRQQVTAESQAERAARICDIIVEEK